jgi:transposase
MRGRVDNQVSMMCLINPEDVVPDGHPLREIKKLADDALASIDEQLEPMYAESGRPSIPPERLLKSMLLMALYSVRSDVQLCEQIQYNLLFRWFLDMTMTEKVWDRSTFSHNRDRLIEHDIGRALFGAVVDEAKRRKLMSTEHFSVDGTLIEAYASMKSFRPKDESDPDDDQGAGGSTGSRSNRWVNFRGKKRSNDTHESKTDPDARLMRKGYGKEAKLSYSGHILMENRNGLIVDLRIEKATGYAERDAAIDMLESLGGTKRITVAADRGYDTKDFSARCRAIRVTPHVAQNTSRRSSIDERTTRHEGYKWSQRIRKRVEEPFGWMKTIGGLRRTRFCGIPRTTLAATLSLTALNILRIVNLSPPSTA